MSKPSSSKAVNTDVLGKAGIIELKNGKVVLKQKPHSFEKHSETLQELVKFRENIQELVTIGDTSLTAIADEHKPLIAKLVHESDKTLSALAKHIHSQLLPPDDDDDESYARSKALLLPLSRKRNNYGLETDLGVKAPASTCVWRWEVRESYRLWLPENAQEKAANRLVERVTAKSAFMTIFKNLPEEQQRKILHTKPNAKSQSGDNGKAAVVPSTSQGTGLASCSSQAVDSPKVNGTDNGNSEQTKPKVGRSKKDTEKVEKAKKEKDAQKSLMSSFFTKPKPNLQALSSKVESAVAGPSTSHSDFDKSFKPFVLKKGAQLAPINAFHECKAGTRDEVIVIDEDESAPVVSTSTDVANTSVQERLFEILSVLPPPVAGPLKRPPQSVARRMKTFYPVTVRNIMKQLSEVEVFGDTSSVRKIHDKLSDRTLFPAKVFIFSEDSRPGYYGTWSRNSRLIGSRSPFVKDVLEHDYGYDSGEDWEEEPAGDADDVMDDAEDDVATEDQDSDIDDWLVDDEMEKSFPIDERAVSPIIHLSPKRKADDAPSKIMKRRKVVVPLVPFAKGPCWETSIGQNDSTFRPFRIRLFNDTPFPIDPFTFVSAAAEERKSIKASEKGFAVPDLPNHASQIGTAKGPHNGPSAMSVVAPSGLKRLTVTPKTAFPEEHLPILLSKINTAQAANLTVLVEAVSQELRDHKVKKNAIEAKIREVGEKCKVRKFWVVKENLPMCIV
ncbi:chromatin assembly factor 1 subunit A-domain-containing protein [Lentinula aciculospora]|uniref:Chromatin assembly factor 1 subunit A-domain-containing protein n=1 Tax=Lentinula aciculospora TaxID=153920 RepID=A0A9W9ASA3_9AGAR|nr:chromatin assembly factor 1 subunit A-domain-containing protein [Lentinula aciculospora]